MKTITFYSYKGGVGRTLALSNIASRLAEFGKRVFIIDFDLEAPGVPFKFNSFNSKKIKNGVVDYISTYVSGGALPSSIKEFTTSINLGQNRITLMPAGNTHKSEYWSKLAAINWNDLFYKPTGQGVEFFLDLKSKIEKEFNPDFLLIDSRTGITEISGITISIFADEVVLFLANNRESIEGTAQVIRSLLSAENQLIKDSPKVNVALCRIPYFIGKEEIYQDDFIKKSAMQKITELVQVSKKDYRLEDVILIHSDRELEVQEKFKIGFRSLVASEQSVLEQVSISKDYLELFEQLTKDVLSDKEIERFNAIKTSELYYERSKVADDSWKKVELLHRAIKLNSEFENAYLDLVSVYINMGNLDDARANLNNLLAIDPDSAGGIYLSGVIYYIKQDYQNASNEFESLHEIARTSRWKEPLMDSVNVYVQLGRISDAFKLCEELIKMAPNSSNVFNLMANTLRVVGRYEDALKYIYKAIQLEPRNPVAYGTLAEINAHLNKNEDFYLNLELSLIFKIDLERVLKEESVYEKYFGEERFVGILNKYNIPLPEKLSGSKSGN